MHEYDDAVLACFLENQLQLFPEEVASTEEEAESFLEDCMAVIPQKMSLHTSMKPVSIWTVPMRKRF